MHPLLARLPDSAVVAWTLAGLKRPGSGLDSDMVRNYIRHRVSRFSVPRDVTFLEALPRNPTGRILERALIAPNDR